MASSVYGQNYGRRIMSRGRVDAYNFLMGIAPERPELPDPNAWVTETVAVFESAHPYLNNQSRTETYHIPGARFMRLKIEEHDLEHFYDYLAVKDGQGTEIQRIDGAGTNTVSDYVEGDTMEVEFLSDATVSYWGFRISEIQYISN